MQRLRIHYAKTNAMRYTSNLDVHKIWERTLRRAKLPLAYSQGFHPQPRLTQACPLPLGLLSRAEMLDIWLESEQDPGEVLHQLQPALPPGLEVQHIEPVDLKAPALPNQVVSSDYTALLLFGVDREQLKQGIAGLLAAGSLPRERRGKAYDLRPYIEGLELLPETDANGHTSLTMRLSARESATGRAEEVLLALGCDPFDARIERTNLILQTEN